MCGICGFTGVPDMERLKRMTDLLVHRGPDGEGFYCDPLARVCLGHRRLSIIDLNTGAQPLANEDGSIWLVFNGEVYNYRELRQALIQKGHRFATSSDTETIVHLYEEYGVDLLEHLNGMFAFALWDAKEERLFIARDRLGVKPLYWTVANGRLLFASEMKALLSWPEVKREMVPESFSLYLSLRNVPEPLTIYKDIYALRPAHYLLWHRNSSSPVQQRYWALDFTPAAMPDEEELCDQIEELLLDATKIRMRSDVPVGAYLSGGVDSSLVVGLVRKFYSGPIHTFCLTYKDRIENKEDGYYSRRIADRFSTDHHEHQITSETLINGLPDLADHLEQPFAGVLSSFFLTELVCKYVKVVLTGDGADDQFGSYGHHRLAWPLYNLEQAEREGAADPFQVADLSPLQDRIDFVRSFHGTRFSEWRARFGAFTDSDKESLLHPDVKQWADRYSSKAFYEKLSASKTAQDPLNLMLEIDIQTLLPNEILFYGDRLSMAHSVEARSPFLDYRLAELSAAIPGSLKIKGNTLKYILKKTARRYLPAEILDRPKEGFVLPKHVWLRGQLDPLLERFLSPGQLTKHGFFNRHKVEEIIHEHKTQIRDHSFRIWALIMFQIWHQKYME